MQHQQQQQQPTLTNVRIRSVDDVHRIFFAVHSGILDIITRRLDVRERQALDSGHLYVFEDRGQHAVTGIGIERFTEGRHWSASRVRDEFLFYYEKWKPPRNQSSGARSGNQAEDMPPPRGWEQMVKQTYTAWMTLGSVRRRFHMIYYWRQSDVDRMRNVEEIDALRMLSIPLGIFRTSRTSNRGRGRRATNASPDAQSPQDHQPPRQSSSTELQASTSTAAASTNPQYSDLHIPNPTPPATQHIHHSAPQSDSYSMSHYTPEYNYASSAPPIAYPPTSQPSRHLQPPGYEQQSGIADESIYVFSTPQAQTSEQHLSPPPPAPNITYNWSHASPHDHIPRPAYSQNESLYVSPDNDSPLPIPMSYVTAHMSPPSSGSSLSSPHSHPASEYSGPSSSPYVTSLSGAQIPPNHYSSSMYTSHSDIHLSQQNGSALPRSPFAIPDSTQYEPFFSSPTDQQPDVQFPMGNTAENGPENPNGVGLAPMSALRRFHPYRRDPTDDQLLSVLGNRRI